MPSGVDPIQFRHKDVQHIEIKAPCVLHPCQQSAAAPKSLHLSIQIRAGTEVGIQHYRSLVHVFFFVIAQGNSQHNILPSTAKAQILCTSNQILNI